MNYKKIYETEFGKIPFDFNIHHIDIDRGNNNLSNLVSIPITLHKRYHEEEKNMLRCYNAKNKVGSDYHVYNLTKIFEEIQYYIKLKSTNHHKVKHESNF